MQYKNYKLVFAYSEILIYAPNGKYVMKCETEEEAKEWIDNQT